MFWFIKTWLGYKMFKHLQIGKIYSLTNIIWGFQFEWRNIHRISIVACYKPQLRETLWPELKYNSKLVYSSRWLKQTKNGQFTTFQKSLDNIKRFTLKINYVTIKTKIYILTRYFKLGTQESWQFNFEKILNFHWQSYQLTMKPQIKILHNSRGWINTN